jgi:hypothetical protein
MEQATFVRDLEAMGTCTDTVVAYLVLSVVYASRYVTPP